MPGMNQPPPQLSLFAAEETEGTHPAVVTDAARALAERVPPWVHFGTSSFTFPGWGKNLVYRGKPTQDDLVNDGLRAYAQHPLLRTVGIDRSYYGPLAAEDLAKYRVQLPAGYPLVFKAWEEITTRVVPSHARYGARAGEANRSFLDPSVFSDVLAPHLQELRASTAAFVFQLAPAPKNAVPSPAAFARELATFFRGIPHFSAAEGRPGPRYAIELRNSELMSPSYFAVLREHGVGHVFNYWTAMPTIGAQAQLEGALTSDVLVVRLMQPPFTRYEELKANYAPFDRIRATDPEMRQDVLHLLERALEAGVTAAFVIVNNKAEGSAPLTCFDLAERVAHWSDPPPLSVPPTRV